MWCNKKIRKKYVVEGYKEKKMFQFFKNNFFAVNAAAHTI